MSELGAFEDYRAHLGGCRECRPKSGQLCGLGLRLHDVWDKAAAAEAEERKQRERAKRHERPSDWAAPAGAPPAALSTRSSFRIRQR